MAEIKDSFLLIKQKSSLCTMLRVWKIEDGQSGGMKYTVWGGYCSLFQDTNRYSPKRINWEPPQRYLRHYLRFEPLKKCTWNKYYENVTSK
jgi:hypothetical protein